jgi:hypothetical protein
MVLTVKPAFGANVSSKDWERFFGKWFPNGVFDGLQVTAGSGLSVNISAGTGHINGYFIDSDTTENRTVNASTTNYVWCRLTRDASNFVTGWNFHITTTATPPSDSFLLAEVVTSGSAVTSVTDTRNSGMAGVSLGVVPSTSNPRNHIRVMNITSTNPYLEFVKSDGTFSRLGARLISITTITSSGTYNTPSDAKFLIVEISGGGGGGAGGKGGGGFVSGSSGGTGGHGGGSGGSGARITTFIFDVASSYTVTIGAGGSGGNGGAGGTSGSGGSLGTSGGSGGNTTFYSITAGGGSAGGSSGGGGSGGSYILDIFTMSFVQNGVGGGNGGSGGNGSGSSGSSGSGNNGHNGSNFLWKPKNITYNGGIRGNGGSGVNNTYSGGGGGGGGGGAASGFGNGGAGGNGGNGGNNNNYAATDGSNGSAPNPTSYGAGGGGGGGGGGGADGFPNGANGGNGGNGASGVVIVYAYG